MLRLSPSPRVREIARRMMPPAPQRRPKPEPLESVVLRVGDDDASVTFKVTVDERVKVRFGTGQEFCGSYRDLPSAIGAAARQVLQQAALLKQQQRLLSSEHDDPRKVRSVRISIASANSIWLRELNMGEFRDQQERYAPLWDAFGQLYRPLVDSFFPTVQGRNPESDIPALIRCRRLWG